MVSTTKPRVARWVEREVDGDVVTTLVRDASLLPAVARVLVGRGVQTLDEARAYLAPSLRSLPDPLELAGINEAVVRLLRAVQGGETIGVFGDYDVDGVTSTTLLWEFLESVGAIVKATIPDRLIEGYGLSKTGVDRLIAQGCTLIVTVDCGVTAHDEVLYASAQGADVVVIDHHTVPVELPRAVAVINPHRLDCARGSEALCAVGVTFNVCLALRRALRERGWFTSSRPEPDLKESLDLVALGTVADVVPLVGENRVLVTHGVKLLRQARRVGLQALLEVARVDLARVDAGTLGFQLGPRVNAAGRLGDAMKAVTLLRATDPREARVLARALDDENQARRDLEARIVQEAIAQVEASPQLQSARIVVVGDVSWHPGVVGIVASRLVDKFGKPAVVVGEGGRGSCRSIERYDVHAGLVAVSSTLNGFGGHAHAAGVRVPEGGLDAFRDALTAHANNALSDDDLGKVLVHDGALAPHDVTHNLCEALLAAAPFGRKNPEPTFLFANVRLEQVRTLKDAHIKARVQGAPTLDVIAFGAAARMGELQGAVDVLATPSINVWNGNATLQLRVKDFRKAGAT